MPCFRCGTRQSDPESGPSPWRRAVYDGRQVLVCPECQGCGDWRDIVDACSKCGSLDLTRRLGQTVCTNCLTLVPAGLPTSDDAPPADDVLSRDVAEAIERVLGRA